MQDVFSILAFGASFDKKWNAEAMKVYRGESISEQIQDNPSPKVDLNSVEEINGFRNKLGIKVKGDDIAPPNSSFKDMMIHDYVKERILNGIEASQWKEPTPIQMQSTPVMISGRDILAGAPTGSGKTAAYLIPIFSLISKMKNGSLKANNKKQKTSSSKGILGLILAPTRELAEQIHREVIRLVGSKIIKSTTLTKSLVSSMLNKQNKTLMSEYDLIVSTPMRLLALIRGEVINLNSLRIVVLDEADKLLEIHHNKNFTEENMEDENFEKEEEEKEEVNSKRTSFLNQVDEILGECDPKSLQRGLFSATIGPLVQDLASSFLRDPIRVIVGVENAGASTIDQKLSFVTNEEGKLLAIRQIIQQGLKPPVLIFLQSKERSKALYKELLFDGINVDVIHAERSELQREQAIESFRKGDTWVLICTDLMARGVDFKGVKMVINYDLPLSAISYIHRIGRTGRAGRQGTAITFFTENDLPNLRTIANVMKLSGCEVPDWMLSIKSLTTKEKRNLKFNIPDRKPIGNNKPFTKKGKTNK